MAIYLFSQILKFTQYSLKLIEKLSRRHLINSSDVFVIKGFTVHKAVISVCLCVCPIKIWQPLEPLDRFVSNWDRENHENVLIAWSKHS